MDIIRVGIVGFGFMGRTHTYGYRTIPFHYPGLPYRTELAGVCTRTMEAAEKARDEYGFGFAVDDAFELVARPDIDVVNVCTPNALHKDVVIAAIRAGKHVYCDKPLATGAAEADEVEAALDGSDVVNGMAFQYRFLPATMRAKQLVEEGRVGRVLSFRAQYLHSGSVDPAKPIGWKLDRTVGGGGVLFDLGSHVLDLMAHLLGEYASVHAALRTVYPERPDKSGRMVRIEAEDQALLTVRMSDGSLGTIEASKIATGANDELRFEIHGDRGALRFDLMDPNWLHFFDNTAAEAPLGGTRGFTRIECVQRYPSPGADFPGPKLSVGWIRAHVECLHHFLGHVHAGTPSEPSLRDGAYVQRVMEKAYESAKTGAWVDVPARRGT